MREIITAEELRTLANTPWDADPTSDRLNLVDYTLRRAADSLATYEQEREKMAGTGREVTFRYVARTNLNGDETMIYAVFIQDGVFVADLFVPHGDPSSAIVNWLTAGTLPNGWAGFIKPDWPR